MISLEQLHQVIGQHRDLHPVALAKPHSLKQRRVEQTETLYYKQAAHIQAED